MNLRHYLRFVIYLIVALGVSWARADAYVDYFRAIERDDAGTVTALLKRGFDPNSRNEQGQVGLYLALRGDSVKTLQALWAQPQLDVDAVNAVGETPLMMAALRGNVEWSRKLIERGARIHRDGWTPLHYAACAPDADVLRLLLDKGAPIDSRSPTGDTPLMMAARYGNETSVNFLIAQGADLKLRNDRGAGAADFARMDGRDNLAGRLDKLTR